ncbi:MAG: 8-oxoguanine deaminase, partial [Flavobacteriales bacterium]
AGGMSDPVASLLTCAPGCVWLSVINGQVVVDEGVIPGLDITSLVKRHNEISQQLVEKAEAASG